MRHSRFISSTPLIAGLLTGVMKTVRDKEVFVVRSVKANGKTYTMRNEHGIEVSPQARERAAKKGVAL